MQKHFCYRIWTIFVFCTLGSLCFPHFDVKFQDLKTWDQCKRNDSWNGSLKWNVWWIAKFLIGRGLFFSFKQADMKGKKFDWKGCMAHEVRHCKSTKMPWHHKVELSNWSWSRSWSWSVHGLFMVIVMFMIMVIVFVMNMVTFVVAIVVVKCQEASWNYKVAVTHTTGPYNYEIGHLREWAHIVCQTRQNNQASKMFCTFKLHIRLQLFSIIFWAGA